ncbi:NUMOD4 domain-containing protein [Sphingobacterium multivorum]|uniref:NUMOD4 domain-containing protein n=1 Tax=Sphingobacterium multivorum TaxID=28454 RepID=UPI003DA4FBCC
MNDSKEIWLPVPNYPNYEVSNLGRVKTLQRAMKSKAGSIAAVNEKIMKGSFSRDGYPIVKISNQFGKKILKVHRLVAMAFIPNPDNKPQVNHINGVKTDNYTDNLEWVTGKENVTHGYQTGLIKASHGESHYLAKVTDEQVLQIRRMRSEDKLTHQAIADLIGVSRSIVTSILSNKTHRHTL